MVLKNILGITDSLRLSQVEELTKIKALELFDQNILDSYSVGTFEGLAKIHKYLFEDIYEFAGEIRDENIAKGSVRFAPMMYLESSLKNILKCLKVLMMKLLKSTLK